MNKVKVSVVDDHVLVRQGIVRLINSIHHFEVISEASSGNEFIEILQKGDLPKIALMDINMANGNGYDTTKWINLAHPEISVLAMSVFEDEKKIISILKCGAKGFIPKWANADQLEKALKLISEGNFYIPELATAGILNGLLSHSLMKEQIHLTEKENKFLNLLCTDMSYKEIATEMYVSPKTIDEYKSNLCRKFSAKTRTGIVISAIRKGLLQVS